MRDTFSYCESIAATATSTWHIRKLTSKGRKLGGGIDTPSLCGRVTSGWDLAVPIGTAPGKHICCECYALCPEEAEWAKEK